MAHAATLPDTVGQAAMPPALSSVWPRRWMCALLGSLLLGGCMAPAATAPEATPTVEPTPLLPTPAPSPVGTSGTTPDVPRQTIQVWWPDALLPPSNEGAARVLATQVAAFEAVMGDTMRVEGRLRRVRDIGGILPTLRSARDVAPGALPDLTLVRREDLLALVQDQLVRPFADGDVTPALLGDVYTSGLALGRVGDALYGLPYTLDFAHMAFAPGADLPDATFEALLDADVPLLMPLARGATVVGDVPWAQYLAAVGQSPSGPLVLDADALGAVLMFYEQAGARGLLLPQTLDYARPSDYRGVLSAGFDGAAVVSSSLYLDLAANGQPLAFAPLPMPTADAPPTTVLNGWVWVLTSPDATRQERALTFVTWMMDVERQSELARQLHTLPSQRSAVRRAVPQGYSAFVGEALAGAVVPLSEGSGGVAGRAFQAALVSVVSGQQTAQEAVLAALDATP